MNVTCRTHGPMRWRFEFMWWTCPGFDGEGCGGSPVTDEQIRRGTCSPNVEVHP